MVELTETEDGVVISITDAEGEHSATLWDGEDGTDGVSPTVSVTEITSGHRVEITDAEGTATFDVMDGVNGTNGTDGTTTGSVHVLDYDFDQNTLTYNRTMTHNLGHVNSVAYCQETDTLICGNGSGSYDLSGEIFLLENLSQRGNTLNRSDCITIDVEMNFGFKVNAVWGEDNVERYDIVYLCTNDSHSIYRLQLGKGANDLGSGTIISGATWFNGTYQVINSWSWGYVGRDYPNCVQGMVFWKNRLVWGYGHNNGLSMRMASLYENGKIVLDGANYKQMDASGNLITRYMAGMTKFGENGEYLGICGGRSLWVVKDWC